MHHSLDRKSFSVGKGEEQIVIYSFNNNEIDRFKFFEKGSIAQSFIFDGLALNVSELFLNISA